MKIYYVRHGLTDWNVQKKLQGLVDTDLNEQGREQARELRSKLADKEIDVVLVSPLKRAAQTAEIINEGRDLPVVRIEGLHERDFGEFEGNIKGQWYEDFWNWNKNLKYQKAENVRDFFDRINNVIDEILTKYHDKNILIVAHGGVGIPFVVKIGEKEIPADGNLLD